jgi:hypothetical protein
MKVQFSRLSRSAYAAAAVLILGVAMVPALSGTAYAYNLVEDRYIKMSSSANGATGVSYEVGFEIATTGNVQGVVVDFCSSTPIIADVCTAPAGFSVGAPTVATTGGANTGLGAGWTAASINSGRTLTLKNSSGGSLSATTPVKFTLSTATNPTTTNTSFYARIFTFATDTAIDTWDNAADGSSVAGVVDAGGVALSTAAQITVTAKVQETLTFCVYTGANCAAGGTAVTLGDTNGVLAIGGAFVDKTTKFDLASNAGSGVTVRFKAPTLTSGLNTIAALGDPGTTSSPASSQFGLCGYVTAPTLLAFAAPYNDSTDCAGTSQTAGTGSTGGDNGATFALDTNGTTGSASTYGDDLATMAAGVTEQGRLAFIGNISATQPAGIYTSTFNFVATGIY